jgi:hypothetical protein
VSQALRQIYALVRSAKHQDIVNLPTELPLVSALWWRNTDKKEREAGMKRIAFVAALGTMLAACSGEPEAEDAEADYVQARTTQQLMAHVVQPNSEIYWNAVRYESELVGDEVVTRDIMPETDEDWLRIRTAAATVSEMGNLLMTPLYAEERGADWIDFSRGLVEAGQLAERAAIDEDVDAVFEAGAIVYNVCQACHQMYPPSELPAGMSEEELRPTEDVPLQEYVEEDGA